MILRRINAFTMALLCFSPQLANALGPVTDSLAGAMRSGIEREATLGNPAALGALNTSFVRTFYGKTRFTNSDSGGKTLALGAYDGQNPNVHAGLEYVRDSRATSFRDQPGYRDRSDVRLGLGRNLWGNVLGGVNLRHITVRDGGPEEKLFDYDLGLLFPLFTDLRLGVLAQNLAKHQRELPSTFGAGLRYTVGSGLVVRGDLAELRNGDSQGQKLWAAGLEVTAMSDFQLRFGMHKDPYAGVRGRGFGIGWIGPRASFDYTLATQDNADKERRHTFSLSVLI